MSFVKRLVNITKANISHQAKAIGELFGKTERKFGHKYFRESDKKNEEAFFDSDTEPNYDGKESFKENSNSGKNYQYDSSHYRSDTNYNYSHTPKQVIDDLSVFGLAPPSSLEEVKRARNREIKKYHSDRFINDTEKFETSKEIMQIYNAAYDRLKDHYNSQN